MGDPGKHSKSSRFRFGGALRACLSTILLLVLLSTPGRTQSDSAGGQFTPFEGSASRRIVPISAESNAAQAGPMPETPASGIVDDLDVLSVKQRTAIARELIIAAVESDIHVYLLTLKKTPAMPIDAYSRELLASWNTGNVSALVLYIADEPDQWRNQLYVVPVEVPGADELTLGLANAATVARSNALEEPNAAAALERASRDLLGQLRALPASVRAIDHVPATSLEEQRSRAGDSIQRAAVRAPDLARRKRNVAIASAGAAALALFGLLIRHRVRNQAVLLPVLDFHYRLCAPYAGGNCARFDFKERHHHSVPSKSQDKT